MDISSRYNRCTEYINRMYRSGFISDGLMKRFLNESKLVYNDIDKFENLVKRISEIIMLQHGCITMSEYIQ